MYMLRSREKGACCDEAIRDEGVVEGGKASKEKGAAGVDACGCCWGEESSSWTAEYVLDDECWKNLQDSYNYVYLCLGKR